MERELFDVDHGKAGAWLIQKMPIPQEFGEVIAHHHRRPLPDEPFGMVSLVRIADRMADALGFFVLSPVEMLDYRDVVEEFARSSGASFEFEAEELRAEIAGKIRAWA